MNRSRKLFFIILCISIASGMFSQQIFAKEDYSKYKEYPTSSEEYLYYYLQENAIKVNKFSKEKKALYKKLSSMKEDELISIDEKKKLGKGTYYARTVNEDSLLYVGELKKNKPDGKGAIFKYVDCFSADKYLARVYVGNFKEGKYEGYGISYYLPEEDISLGVTGQMMYTDFTDNIQENIFLSTNPIEYEGMFKDGKFSGKGVEYTYTIDYNKYVDQLNDKNATDKNQNSFVKIRFYGNGYVFENSDKVLLSTEDYIMCTEDDKQIGINEIYARHGRLFNDSKIQQYFDKQNWYNGTIAPEDFDESTLSDIEQNNIKILKGEITPEKVKEQEMEKQQQKEKANDFSNIPLEISAISGSYKKGKRTGKFRVYNGKTLIYKGGMKDGELDGRGKKYSSTTGQLIYDGEFLRGDYHGEGILYDENGEVKYSGEWSYGEYAD